MHVFNVKFVNKNVPILKTYRNTRKRNIQPLKILSVMIVIKYLKVKRNLMTMRKPMKNLNVTSVTKFSSMKVY